MIIEWNYGEYAQYVRYYGPLGYISNGSRNRMGAWTYDPTTGIVCVTVVNPGTYCYNIGRVGGGTCYLRRR